MDARFGRCPNSRNSALLAADREGLQGTNRLHVWAWFILYTVATCNFMLNETRVRLVTVLTMRDLRTIEQAVVSLALTLALVSGREVIYALPSHFEIGL